MPKGTPTKAKTKSVKAPVTAKAKPAKAQKRASR